MKQKFKLAILSGKGGVGKSMLASALAMLLVKKNKVIAVDADVDAPNFHLWLGEDEKWDETEKISVSEKPIINQTKCNLCGQCVKICQFNALTYSDPGSEQTYDPGSKVKLNPYFCEGCAACEVVCPQKAIRMQPIKNAEIKIKKIRLRQDYGGQAAHGFPLVSAQLYPGETGSGKIVDQIKERAEKYNYKVMILDSPAGIGCPVIAALNGTDFAILITEPTPSGFSDLKRALTVVNHFQIPYGVVINKWDINPDESSKIEKWAQDKLLGKIAYDQQIFQAIANLTPIMETDLPAKKEVEKIYHQLKRRLT